MKRGSTSPAAILILAIAIAIACAASSPPMVTAFDISTKEGGQVLQDSTGPLLTLRITERMYSKNPASHPIPIEDLEQGLIRLPGTDEPSWFVLMVELQPSDAAPVQWATRDSVLLAQANEHRDYKADSWQYWNPRFVIASFSDGDDTIQVLVNAVRIAEYGGGNALPHFVLYDSTAAPAFRIRKINSVSGQVKQECLLIYIQDEHRLKVSSPVRP